MARDTQDHSRLKHRRSSDKSEGPSKRRKHRHSSRRKHEEDRGDEIKHVEDEIETDKGAGVAPPPRPPLVGVVSCSNSRPDYDMEEGEIVETEGFGGDDDDTVKKNGVYDLECGEIKAVEVRGESDNYNMGAREVQDGVTLNSGLPLENNLDRSGRNSNTLGGDDSEDELVNSVAVDRKETIAGGSKIHDETGVQRNSSSEHHTNGNIAYVSCKEEDRTQIGSGPPIKGSYKRKIHCDDESDTRDQRKSLSSENTRGRHKIIAHLPSPDRYHEEVHSRNRSRLCGQAEERSRSQIILQEALPLKGRWETWERDRVGREINRDRKREEDQDRDLNKDRERTRERDRDSARERGKERVTEREGGKEREREKERARDRDRERKRERERDKEGYRVSRYQKYEIVDNGYGDRHRYNDSRYRKHDETGHRNIVRKNGIGKVHSFKNDLSEGDKEKLKRDEDELEDYQERIALQLEDKEEEDLNRVKEESRRRRLAILEKHKTQQLQQQHGPYSMDIGEQVEQPSHQSGAVHVVPEVLDDQGKGGDVYVAHPLFSISKSPPQNGISAFERTSGAGGLGEGTPKSERSGDMFCDDIFGVSPAGVRKPGKGDGLAIETSSLHDNWDDSEGYYNYRFGEILDCRYEITAAQGKGVFSTVVRTKDLNAAAGGPEEVAIKIIRNNETMYRVGLEELVILKKIVTADPENRRHCVRFLSSFKYRNHLCLVFESLHMNLREVLKKFGRNIGLKLTAVRAYAKQLFIALKHLKNCGVLHCDIKPDNMLVNEAKNVLKLCDFGNAMFAGKNEITPYLVSRFYRAPEIILGLPYDHSMDIWSAGCCLFELYTGKVLFPGSTNNDMLRLHMELKGPFPKKMLRKGAFIDQHFDQDLNLLATEEDPVTKTIKRLILNIRPKDIGTIVMNSPGVDPKMLANFKDLLEKIFVLDPDKRLTVSQALSHPFITGK